MQLNVHFFATIFVWTVLTDLLTQFYWKLIYMYVIRWCISEIIDLPKISIGNCKSMQHGIFYKYICMHGFDWSPRYIMSIIAFNCQHCNEQQFQTLSCVHYTIFSVVMLDLLIRVLLLDTFLLRKKNTRTARVHLATFFLYDGLHVAIYQTHQL